MLELNFSKKQLNPIIEKYGIDVENDTTFHRIINMFSGQTSYHIWAIKLVYGNVCTLDCIEEIRNWIIINPTEIKNLIRKNIICYTTSDELKGMFSEIRGLNALKNIREGAALFNTNQRKMITQHCLKRADGENLNGLEAFMNLHNIAKWEKMFESVKRLPKSRKEKMISLASALTDIDALFEHIDNALTSTYEWNREDLLSYVERNTPDCKVVFDADNVIVLNVPSFKSSRSLCGKGRTSWCLTREERYFKQYVTDCRDAKQYFLFDFNKREDHQLAHIGFTVRKNDGIVDAHSTRNDNMIGGGIMIENERINVQSALRKVNVPLSTYISLKNPSYTWSKEAVLRLIASKPAELAIAYDNNNRLIVHALTPNGAQILLGHTMIRSSHWSCNDRQKLYILLDFNLPCNMDGSIVAMRYVNDRYGSMGVERLIDNYNGIIQEKDVFDKINIKRNDFLNCEAIDPNVLLHKLINERNEVDAIDLLRQNRTLNVNFEFESNLPIFSAIENKLFNLFEAIVNHNTYNSVLTDGYGETVLHRLLYAYDNSKSASSRENKDVVRMINTMIDSDNIDFNVQDINAETVLNVACSNKALLWVVEKLIAKDSVNVNIVDDFNFTPLGAAISSSNIEAIKMLGTRKDLVIRESDVMNATKKGINLYDIIEPNDNSEDNLIINEDINELSEIFAQAFGCF